MSLLIYLKTRFKSPFLHDNAEVLTMYSSRHLGFYPWCISQCQYWFSLKFECFKAYIRRFLDCIIKFISLLVTNVRHTQVWIIESTFELICKLEPSFNVRTCFIKFSISKKNIKATHLELLSSEFGNSCGWSFMLYHSAFVPLSEPEHPLWPMDRAVKK